jgi:hypothetical protein
MRDYLDVRDKGGGIEDAAWKSSIQSHYANARHLLKVLIQRYCVSDVKPLHDHQARAARKTPLLIAIGREDNPGLLQSFRRELFQLRRTAIEDARSKPASTIRMTTSFKQRQVSSST